MLMSVRHPFLNSPLYPPFHLSPIHLVICPFIDLSITYPSHYPPIRLSICLSTHLPIPLFTHLFIHPARVECLHGSLGPHWGSSWFSTLQPSVHSSIQPSIFPSIHPSIYPSIHLPTYHCVGWLSTMVFCFILGKKCLHSGSQAHAI